MGVFICYNVSMKFTIPDGTQFQRRVWTELTKIPKGHTITYKELAKRVGKPLAVRAVGNAVGKNPMLETIPCHRVIRSDGKLGGYSGKGGVKRKLQLLKNEGAII